ncbi:MAG: MBOAT family protein [Lachnospiraceae bacterium]|nr:MBOAT family protein [Lachnospiraceae bacterium]
MLFNSLPFLIFFPFVALLYFIIPDKLKPLWLLFASYFFYMSWNPLYGILLFAVTVITWLTAIFVDLSKQNKMIRKALLTIGVLLTLFFLLYFKYAGFIYANIIAVFARFNISAEIKAFDIIMPVGISFYTFQALGYVFDVYRNKVRAEKNLLHHALFVSFFPQLLAGPIGRADKLKPQLLKENKFSYENARYGLLLMLWGYFLKMIIADHAAVLVDSVYDNFHHAIGYQIVIATLLFAIQVYCDFSAYSYIAIGAARIMGIHLGENFRQPYLAVSVKEFWHRWHISLSTWFRDYLYIPLGGNRFSKARKYRNIMITFLISGLWHGASWNFIAWGGLHGIFQIISDISKPYQDKYIKQKYKSLRIIITFFLISFAWIFFRADGLSAAIYMIGRIFNSTLTGQVNDAWIFNPILLIGIVLLLPVDAAKEKYDVFAVLLKQKTIIRWVVYYALVLTILFLGIYGTDYVQTQFIYFDF